MVSFRSTLALDDALTLRYKVPMATLTPETDSSQRLRPPEGARVLSLPERAEADLRLIRDTMSRSATFTHISGRLVVGLGLLAFVAAAVAQTIGTTRGQWIAWLSAAVIGAIGGFLALDRKARLPGQPVGSALLRGAGRRFTFGMVPPLAAGALITSALMRGGGQWIPGVWLSLYGVALIVGGMNSVRVVRVLGGAFVTVGTVALHVPAWGGELLVVGFGGFHLTFGVWIWRRYGG